MPEYPFNWGEIAFKVKEAAGWRCVNCGHPHDVAAGYMLTVHHIDEDTFNNEPWNLVALCQRCHLHYQHHQDRRQLSFEPRPKWLQRYFDALQSISSGIDLQTSTKLPVKPR